MATITKEREARFDERNSQPEGRSGSGTPKKTGPAVTAKPRHPNGGASGGVFRTPRGGVKENS